MKMKKNDPERIWSDPKAFRQQVRMAAVQAAGLSPEELAAALAYEVEPFSGIPAGEAELVFRPVSDPDPTVRVFDVAAVRSARGAGGSPVPRRLFVWLGAAAAALLVLAAFDFVRISSAERRLSAETARRAALDAELKSLQGRIDANRREAKALRDARVEAARAQQNAEVLRDVYRLLLDTVSEAFGERAVLKEIRATGRPYSAEITAVSLGTKPAAEALVRLSDALVPRGWRIDPGAISADGQGGTVAFSCTLAFDEGGEFK